MGKLAKLRGGKQNGVAPCRVATLSITTVFYSEMVVGDRSVPGSVNSGCIASGHG